MEFWGIEVKPGQVIRCEPEGGSFLHLSQAALGEPKKGNDSAVMYVKVEDQKLVIGTLSADKYPQIQFDLVFDKDFELSHTSKTTSVFFSGYKVLQQDEGDEMDFDSEEIEDEEEEKIVQAPKENGKGQGKENEEKKLKAPVTDAQKKKDDDNDDDDDSDEDDSDDEDLSSEEDGDDSTEDGSTEDDEDESDEEETPKKPETGKKRAADIVLKTPASDKKAKVATPSGQKTGDKKGVHVATPHPAKHASKTPVNNEKAKEKSPKSGGGSVPCKSCSKTFNSEMALQSHTKAKHSSK